MNDRPDRNAADTRRGIDRTAAKLARSTGKSFDQARDRVVRAVTTVERRRENGGKGE